MREWFDLLPPAWAGYVMGITGSVIIGIANFGLLHMCGLIAKETSAVRSAALVVLTMVLGLVGFGGGCGMWAAGMDARISEIVDEGIAELEQQEKTMEKTEPTRPKSKVISLLQAATLEQMAKRWWEEELKTAAAENRRPVAEQFYVGMGARRKDFVIRIRHWPDSLHLYADRFVEYHILSECDYMQTRCDWIGERWSEWHYTIEEYKWDR
jgi:hypothetical protein